MIHSLLPQVQDINPISDEVVEIRLTMSPDLLRSFVSILEGLTSFFIQAKNKEELIQALKKAREPEQIRKTKAEVASRKQLCIETYQNALADGLNAREAISATNKALKEQGHRWSCYHIVYETVKEAGLLRGTDFYRKKRKAK